MNMELTEGRQISEAQAIQYAKELSALLAQEKARRQELEMLNSKLGVRNKELQEFAFIASHDLMEPLRKICLFGDRLLEHRHQLDEKGLEYLTRMQTAVTRMQAYIDGLLVYSRVNTREPEIQPLDLKRIMANVLARLEINAKYPDAKITLWELPEIEADSHHVFQIFYGLLDNALKFNCGKKDLEIVISGMHKEDGTVEISVADNGMGFDEKYLDRIFKPFQRLSGRSKFEGTGMGLAICKKAAEFCGGTITAHGTPGKGAVFTVKVPAKVMSH